MRWRPLSADSDPSLKAAGHEALTILVKLIAPMMPHLAQECWQVLGHRGFVAAEGWPTIDQSLLVDEEVTLPIQINGKKRGDLTVPATASKADIEKAALESDVVQRALAGGEPKRLIVVPGRIVNVVV